MTIYPGSIDTNTSLPLVIDDVTPVTAITVNRLRETLIAVETELGTDPSGGYSTVASRLTALEASGGAAHATTHEDGGSDELTIQNLGSGTAAADKVVVTDGAGGLTLQDYSTGISGSGTDNHLVRWSVVAGVESLQDSGIVVSDGASTITIEDPGANTYLDFASSEYVIGRTRYIRTVSPITAGYRGDSLTIEAGDGADGGASGGQGGNVGLYSGDGGEAATAGNTSSAGGSLTIQSGYGGDGNTSGGKPHWGGTLSINAGRGGYIQAGSTINPTFSKGGAINILAGDGCTSFEPTVAATIGGALTMEGGEGGLGYNATGDGGPGGTTTIQGGRSGQAAGSGNDGAGGSVQIDAGRNYSGAQGTVDLGYTDRWGASWASAIRCFVPTTIYNSLFIGSTTTSENFLDIEDGTGAAVSAAGDVRIRNNSGKLEVSEDGYAYAPLGYVDTGAAKTGAYSADIGELVKVDPSGGGFAVTLPTAVGYANQGITIKNVTNSTNAVTFNTTGGQTMDGAASGADQIDTAYETVTFISDGSNWMRFPAA